MCRGRSVTYVLALAWVPKCVLELWLAHYKNFKPKVCITGASSVINVDSYDEAALEETKLAKRDYQSSKDAWTSSWYGCGCRPFAVRLARPLSGGISILFSKYSSQFIKVSPCMGNVKIKSCRHYIAVT